MANPKAPASGNEKVYSRKKVSRTERAHDTFTVLDEPI